MSTTPSAPTAQPNPTPSPTFNIFGDSACTWDNTLYAEIGASNTLAVFVADNDRFTGAPQFVYQSGNASRVLPAELQSSADPSKMYIAWDIPETVEAGSTYELFAVALGMNGTISQRVTDSILFSSVNNCDYPYPAELDEDGDITEDGEDSQPQVEITPVSPGDLIRTEDSPAVFYVTENLTKRPFTEYSIYLTWGGDRELVIVTPETLPTLLTGEPMLPKGPAVIYFEGNPNPHYIDGANNPPREATVTNVMRDLLGSTWRPELHQILPAYLEGQITKGQDITRANLRHITIEWRDFVRPL